MKQLPTKKPWHRWSEESDTAYDRFMAYLKMGTGRSLDKVRQEYGKSTAYKRQLERWSSKYDWIDRATSYDEFLLLKSLQNREKLIDVAHARMLKMLEKALDTYEEILFLDNVIYVGEGSTTTMNDRIKIAKDILDRLGIDFRVKEGTPNPDQQPTYNQINTYFYQKLNGKDELNDT